jgi:putative radical SAM enzyme (TIGR03279 family)
MAELRVQAPGVRVEAVDPESPADRAGIQAGDRILAVSGKPVTDLLDLFYLTGRKRFDLEWRTPAGEGFVCAIRPEGEPLGVHPEPVKVRKCRNRCIFCFVHQLPKGLRRPLYIKDEDVRLSFLHGQYVTLTDVTDDEMKRIVKYRLTPLYVSIHTTDNTLRRRMLGNPRARDIGEIMGALIRKGISIHGQIVVCPGVNDGPELERTLSDLVRFRPGLATVAVVPVGLTSHRAGLPELRPVATGEAAATIDMIERIRKAADDGSGEPFVMAADEYYLLAGRPVPGRKVYGSFAQIENGVGLVRLFLDEASALLRRKKLGEGGRGGVVVTGVSPSALVGRFVSDYSEATGTPLELVAVPNRLMGPSVTVTGLVSGGDIAAALASKRPSRIYVPSVMLRDAGDIFLDDMSPDDLGRATGAEVVIFDPSPIGFHEAVFSGNPASFR